MTFIERLRSGQPWERYIDQNSKTLVTMVANSLKEPDSNRSVYIRSGHLTGQTSILNNFAGKMASSKMFPIVYCNRADAYGYKNTTPIIVDDDNINLAAEIIPKTAQMINASYSKEAVVGDLTHWLVDGVKGYPMKIILICDNLSQNQLTALEYHLLAPLAALPNTATIISGGRKHQFDSPYLRGNELVLSPTQDLYTKDPGWTVNKILDRIPGRLTNDEKKALFILTAIEKFRDTEITHFGLDNLRAKLLDGEIILWMNRGFHITPALSLALAAKGVPDQYRTEAIRYLTSLANLATLDDRARQTFIDKAKHLQES